MANVGGKAVGRVRVRAVPDSSQFRRDLKVMLTRAERTMSMTLKVDADLDAVENQLRRFKRDWDGKKVNLGANIRSAAAAAQLRFLSRERFVTLSVRVSKASLVKVGTALAALSGGRIVGDLVKNVTESLGSLDRALPKIALVANAVGSLASLSLSAVGGLFTLGTGLLQVFGVAAALPGILAGFAVGATVLVLALSDTKNQLADLAPDFQNLRAIVVDNFWAVAAQPIRDFVYSVLPSVQTGLANTAGAVGRWTSSIVQSFQTAFGGGVLDRLFVNLVSSIDIASTGTGGFAQALVTLGSIGGANLPRLAQWVADLANQFNDFITRVEANGALQAFIDNGVIAAQQLGSALYSIGSIFSGITDAANAAGGGGLATFASILAMVAAAVDSPAFQSVLTQFFTGAAAGAAGLATALEPIGNMLLILAPAISNILASSGQVIGDLLGQIATAASSPVFQRGLRGFFSGLQAGLLAVGPSLPAVANAFGVFLEFAGQLAASIGPVLGEALGRLAPILSEILGALGPMLPKMAEGLSVGLGAVLSELEDLADAAVLILPAATDLFVIVVTPTNINLLSLLAGAVATLAGAFQFLVSWLGGATTLIAGVIGQFTMGGGSILSFLQLLVSIPGPLGDVLRGFADFATGILNSVIDALNGIGDVVEGFVNAVSQALNLDVSIKLPAIPQLRLTVPKLASGADILPRPGGTLALLGEGGRRETVTDYGKTNRLIDLALSLGKRSNALRDGGLDGATITIPVTAAPGDDPRITAQAVGREIGDLMAGR